MTAAASTLGHRLRMTRLPVATHPLESTDSRLHWLKAVLALGLLAGLLLSTRLWLSERAYPLNPVFEALPEPPSPLDRIVLVALLGLAVAALASRRPRGYLLALAAVVVLLALGDQSRWQPWVYQYLFMALALSVYTWGPEARAREAKRAGGGEEPGDGGRSVGGSASGETALGIGRIVVAGVYLWSGLQKANATFVENTFPWLVEPFTDLLPASLAAGVAEVGFLVPALETAIGAGLLTRRFRNYAVIAALMMHCFILLSIGPLGHGENSVVWPWNLAMMCIVVLLFWNTGRAVDRPDRAGEREPASRPGRALRAVVIALFLVLPAFSFVGAWDSYLSSTLYSGKTPRGTIVLDEAAAKRLPEAARRYTEPKDGRYELSLFDWSMGELNVPPYPEPRIFEGVTRELCAAEAAFDEGAVPGLRLDLREPTGLFTTDRSATARGCSDL